MKYALKPASPYINIIGANKIIYFEDEKSVISFFHSKMKQDLVNPIAINERWADWRIRNCKSSSTGLDVVGYYSVLVSENVNLQQLCVLKKVSKTLAIFIGDKTRTYADVMIIRRMRSLPCNYTLYELYDQDHGKMMRRLTWTRFFKQSKDILKHTSIDYKIAAEIAE
jgi:hypothetical protein